MCPPPASIWPLHAVAPGQRGDPAAAAAAYEELPADQVRVSWTRPPETLATRDNLAGWVGDAGDAAGAAAMFDQLLADRLRVLGPAHPTTRGTLASLAYRLDQAATDPS
ncbi:tetratricopeptide repeat protein [Streptomyces sp. NPDC015532]|uniref:tetratricopeptide repeat protein n=1 Tax=Streptomyces sp. NPDC015532 TaxID=3364960 RepID=UPI0036FDB89A